MRWNLKRGEGLSPRPIAFPITRATDMETLNITEQKNGRYLIITPMRNEIRTVETTIKALLAQTILPQQWIILDDGSSDGCEAIVERYTQEYPWIRLIKVKDRGHDFVGQGVADLLNHGLRLLAETEPVEYLAKLDADMNFKEDYFENLISEFEHEPRLGIASGHPYVMKNNKLAFERHSDFFPSGTARLYRVRYLNEIGYFISSVGWDTVDILRMRMRGHLTKICHDLPIHHMRPMGTRQGYINGMVRDGRNNYLTGYMPLFFVLRAIFNGRYFPYVVRTACMLYGYFSSYVKNLPRIVTEDEYKFHSSLQKKRLLFRKI